MNCRRARRIVAIRDQRPIEQADRQSLERHLDGCPLCAATARSDAWLLAGLSSLRGQIPYTIDVRSRVMLTIERMDPVEPYEVPAWQLGWAALVAGLGLAGLLRLLWSYWPQWRQGLGTTAALLGGLADLASSVGAALMSLLTLPFELLGALGGLWTEIAPALAHLEPVAVASVAVCYLIVGGTVARIVGRDLHQPVEPLTRED